MFEFLNFAQNYLPLFLLWWGFTVAGIGKKHMAYNPTLVLMLGSTGIGTSIGELVVWAERMPDKTMFPLMMGTLGLSIATTIIGLGAVIRKAEAEQRYPYIKRTS